jgi:hypothetical protein
MKLPAWIPNINAWMSAILLLLLVRGMKFAIREIWEATGERILNLLSSTSHLVLYLLLLLSPIVVIAIAHNLLHIFLDLFFPDIQTPEMSTPKSIWFPSLMSWWEGFYGWLTIALVMIISTIIGIIIFSPSYYLSEMTDWWYGMKNFFNPLMLIRLISAAYLYQFEYLVRTHLMTIGAEKS